MEGKSATGSADGSIIIVGQLQILLQVDFCDARMKEVYPCFRSLRRDILFLQEYQICRVAKRRKKGGNRMDQVNFGQRLKQCRKEKGFSQEEVAERIGVSAQAISKWEKGEVLIVKDMAPDITTPRLYTTYSIC